MAQVAEPQADSEELLSGESGDMPSAEQLLSILDELKGLSEEEREDLRQSLLSAKLPPVMLEQEASPMTSQSMVLVSMLGILTLIFDTTMSGEDSLEIDESEDDGIGFLQNLLLSKNSPIHMTEEMKERFNRLAEGYRELNAEEKEEFRSSMTQQIADKVTDSVQGRIWSYTLQRGGIVALAAVIILFIFVFFGYKLYKSLTDKERKRDEKRKMKQQKKKK